MRVVMDEKDNAAATMEVMITVTEVNDKYGRFRAIMPLGVDTSFCEYGETRQAAAEACSVYALNFLSTNTAERKRLAEGNHLLMEANAALINARPTEQGFLCIPHIANDRDFSEAVLACDQLLQRKGNDYTQGAEGDYGRLKNFYTSADALDISPFKSLALLWKKHIDAIMTFFKKGQVESEPIEGRFHDAINYELLALKMIAYEKRKLFHQSTDGTKTISGSTKTISGISVYIDNRESVPMAVVDNQGLVK